MKWNLTFIFISSFWLDLFEYMVGYVYIVNLQMSTVRTIRWHSRLGKKEMCVSIDPTDPNFLPRLKSFYFLWG